MFTRFRTYAVFKTKLEPQPARPHGGHGAASVIPYMRADEDSRISGADDTEPWSVFGPVEELKAPDIPT
ncbi:hypothetical protein EZ313_01595 [Ramlibacter henchirensis]|uniref:Uncharacterized protein n=1 Tax=Ramlibacter henchirensis TaxID=204072 RepID=A0A4Z0C1K2_9BURK|nr:hypothetical protein [Ramlibacter henchirensis]TFZ05393.1 hypothetical protein EZ313_01595 [Ramlibacter henchirensis]